MRILIADDHPLYRKGMRTLLGSVSGFEVVGEAETGAAAVAMSLSTIVVAANAQLLRRLDLRPAELPGGPPTARHAPATAGAV